MHLKNPDDLKKCKGETNETKPRKNRQNFEICAGILVARAMASAFRNWSY